MSFPAPENDLGFGVSYCRILTVPTDIYPTARASRFPKTSKRRGSRLNPFYCIYIMKEAMRWTAYI